MRNFKNAGPLLKHLQSSLAIALLLLASCSKELDEKKPDDFDRDVHPISLFDETVEVETVDEGTQTLSVKSDIDSGIYALNELSLRPIRVVSGPKSLEPLFNGLMLESTKAGEKFKFSFKLTKEYLIGYMEADSHNLSTANRELVVNYKNKPQVAIFHFDVDDYGIVRNRPNDLDEPTRFIEFKSTKKSSATHLKMNVVPENRVLSGLRGHYDEDIFLKNNLEARNWNLSEVAKLFHIQTASLTGQNAKSQDKRARIIDDTLYVMGQTSFAELSTIEKLALAKGDPRYSKCDGSKVAKDEVLSSALCVIRPIYSGEAKKVRLKLKKDEDGEVLGTVDLETVTGSSKASFAMIDTSTLFTRFEYDERITNIENRYIYDFKEVHNQIWDANELSAYLKVKKDMGKGVRKTIVFDKQIWVLAPVKKSEATEIELASIGKDQRFSVCGSDILAADSSLKANNCILKPFFMLPAAPMGLTYKFYDGKETPSITLEPLMGEEQADFLVVVSTLDLFDYTYARSYKDVLFDKSKLHNRVFKGNELKRILPSATFAKSDETYLLKVLNSSIWILKAQKKADLEVLERAMAGNDPRFDACPASVSSATGIALADCFLKPIANVGIAHAIVDFEDADNQDLPDLEVRSNVDRRISTHLIIPEKVEVDNYEFAKLFTETEEFSEIADLDNQSLSGQTAAKILGISELASEKLLKTKLVYDNLYVLAPTKKSELHVIEQTSLKTDPRYEVCSMEVAEAAKIDLADCVMRPLYSRAVAFVALYFEADAASDIPRSKIEFDVTKDRAQMLYFKKSSEARKFEYMRNLDIADRIHLNREKDFDLESEYLYVTMTHGTPREVLQADPFYQGNEKLVHLRFTKEGLEVYEKDRDDRFRQNALNEKPVLLIPGSYEDYRCQTDANGNCLAGIEMNNDLTWDQKQLFVPTFENMQVKEINTLDIATTEADPCLIPNGVTLASYEVKKGVINIELEKSYKMSKSWRCIAELYFADTTSNSGLSNGGFKVRFNYSIVRLADIASSDYEPVNYPVPDHGEFGFFKNYERKLNDDFDSTRTNQTYLLNRWNPKKKVVTYHLSDTFNEKGQELIKESTYKVFDGLNIALKQANAGIQLKLEEPSGKLAGDLRYNVIQLITDPLSNGLLGYAPTVTNPYTGEIVQGHVNMYSGVIRSMSRRIWENMVDLTIEQKQEALAGKMVTLKARGFGAASEQKGIVGNTKRVLNAINASNAPRNQRGNPLAKFKRGATPKASELAKLQERAYQAVEGRLKEVRKETLETSSDTNVAKHLKFIENRLARWSENNAYAQEFFRIAHTAKTLFPGIKEIDGVMEADGTLKRWNKLNSEQKKKAMDIMVPFSYVSTLVHEMGHSLGLRHNFIGSFDSANYYSEEEAQALGMRAAPAYSSIMDYSASELNNLMMMGKYDVAALRFGYAREIELENGEFAKITTTLQDLEESGTLPAARKAFSFCTDENASLSSTCNRFDEGSTLVEIAKAKIEDYKQNYRYRNFRDDRDDFQAEGLLGYTIGRMQEFDRIRNIFEEWEFFTTLFNYPLMLQGCSEDQVKQFPVCQMINDRRDATLLVGDFFLEVLKTPDHLCAVLDPKAQVVEQVQLSKLYDDVKFETKEAPTTCFDASIVAKVSADGKQIVAEVGKFLNGFKDNNPNYIYSNDRFARGVWIDKMMAMKALYQRESGKPTTETEHLALVDHPQFGPQVENVIEHILAGAPLNAPIPFKTAEGAPVNPEMLTYAIKSNELIDGPSDSIDVIKNFFGLPSTGKEALGKALLYNAKNWGIIDDIETRDVSRRAVNFFTVRKTDLMDNVRLDNFLSMAVGEINYSAGSENKLASTMIQTTMMAQSMGSIPPESLIKVFQARANQAVIGEMTALKRFAMVSTEGEWTEFLDALLNGAFASEESLKELTTKIGLAKTWSYLSVAPNDQAELQAVIEMREKLNTIPDDATELEKELYGINLMVLAKFLGEVDPALVTPSLDNLKFLPSHVKEISTL